MNTSKKLEERNNTLYYYDNGLIIDIENIEQYSPSEVEKNLISKIFPKSFLDGIKDTHGKSILEQIKELNEWQNKILENKDIPKGILNYIVTINTGEYDSIEKGIGIKPNKFMPVLSSVFLHKKYELCIQPLISLSNTIITQFNKLNNEYLSEKEKLKDCKDREYADNILKELKNPINNYYKKNKIILDEYKENKIIFENYLKNQELLNEFNLINENIENKKNIKKKGYQ